MEDISGYSDEQVGAAVRDVQQQSRQALEQYLKLQPVIDGVEGDFTKTDGLQAASVKLVGNVPPSGKAPGGLLRQGLEGGKGRPAGTASGKYSGARGN